MVGFLGSLGYLAGGIEQGMQAAAAQQEQRARTALALREMALQQQQFKQQQQALEYQRQAQVNAFNAFAGGGGAQPHPLWNTMPTGTPQPQPVANTTAPPAQPPSPQPITPAPGDSGPDLALGTAPFPSPQPGAPPYRPPADVGGMAVGGAAQLRSTAAADAVKAGIDPGFYQTLIGAESAWKPNAVNPTPVKGEHATGIAQFLPSTARREGVDPLDPQQSLAGGANYFATLLRNTGGDYVRAAQEYGTLPKNLNGPLTPGQRSVLAAAQVATQRHAAQAGMRITQALGGAPTAQQALGITNQVVGSTPPQAFEMIDPAVMMRTIAQRVEATAPPGTPDIVKAMSWMQAMELYSKFADPRLKMAFDMWKTQADLAWHNKESEARMAEAQARLAQTGELGRERLDIARGNQDIARERAEIERGNLYAREHPATRFQPFQSQDGRFWGYDPTQNRYVPSQGAQGPVQSAPGGSPSPQPGSTLPTGPLTKVGAAPKAGAAAKPMTGVVRNPDGSLELKSVVPAGQPGQWKDFATDKPIQNVIYAGTAGAAKDVMGAARNTSPQEIDTVAKAIANYQIAPLTGWVLRGDWGKAVMARVMQLNPNYQASQFAARTSAARAFSSGPLGNFIRSFSVAESHLDLASQLAEALQNGKSQTLNRLRNTLRTEFGSAAVPNFETAKQIVADEVAKAVIGGQMGEGDRQNLQRQLDAASSPEQLAGAIQTFRSLMAGQLEGFKRQYMTSTGGTEQDFDRMLSPEARREMAPRGQTGGQAASAQPAASAALPKGQYPIPSSKAVATLKAHPEMAPQFDQAFGPGAAKRALGQ